jgi:uncharacterized RDD family membrane protein YckC
MEETTLPEYATVSQRFTHRIIDFVLFWSFVWGLNRLSPTDSDSLEDLQKTLVIFSLSALYYLACEAVFGKTLGKLITRTTVLKMDGSKPDFSDIFGRTICRIIPLNSVSIFFNGYVCWHDKFSGTYVAQDE